MANASFADWVTAIGTMLAGLAGVAAVILAMVTAKAWRSQTRAAKEAEVAGEALIAVQALLRAARRTTVGYRTVPELAKAVHDRWSEMVHPAEQGVRTAAARAAAYLPDQAALFLTEALDHVEGLHTDQWLWGLKMDAGVPTPDDFKDVFGDGRREALQALEKRAVAVLKPLARLEQ
jgi:hypothetical protein